MYSLARLTLARGAAVSGSDREENNNVRQLMLLGCRVYIGHSPENARGADLVVYSQAISPDNPELVASRKTSIPTVSRADYLGALMLDYSTRIGVSGSHGKSTTVAMLDCIFTDCGESASVLSGADLTIGEPFRFASKGRLIYEACEYKDSFLSFSPTVAVGLNLELDHTDYFSDITQIKSSFTKALGRATDLAILSGDDQNLMDIRKDLPCRTLTFGRSDGCDYRYSIISYLDRGYLFSVFRQGSEIGRFVLNIPGEYNVHNATAAITVAIEQGISVEHIANAIASYGGIARRLQPIGRRFDREVFYDYAHHPTEIAAAINALKTHIRRPITVIFKPHTYSRTKSFWQELCASLSLADYVILLDIYPAREQPIEGVSSEKLAEEIGKSAIYSSDDELFKNLDLHTRGAIVLMGAGDFKDIKTRIINSP